MTFRIICPIMSNEVKTMADYRELYLSLFDDMTKAIEGLKEAQQKAEALFIENEEASAENANENDILRTFPKHKEI